jgi:lipopolysaccharide assembly outer membrane protein LptD (OstA)
MSAMPTLALRFVLLVAIAAACLALAQKIQSGERKQIPASGGAWVNVQVAANSIERGAQYPSIIHLKGNVEIKMKGLKLFADEAEFNEADGEIEARGVVRVVPYPAVDAYPRSN